MFGIECSLQTKRLANNPLDSVSSDCPFNFSVDTDTDAIVSKLIGTVDQGVAFRSTPPSLPVHFLKLPSLPQQGRFREFKG